MPSQSTSISARERARIPVYPDLPLPGQPQSFWLAAYLRDAAHLDEINAQIKKPGFHNKKDAYVGAIYTARQALLKEAQESFKYVISDGLLPFAHAHTTYFDQRVAA